MKVAIGCAVAALVVGVAGAGIGVIGLATAGEANDKADTILEARQVARKVACDADNENAGKINGLNDRSQDLLRDAAAGGNRTPEQQARADQFIAEQIAKYEALKIPLRDCSSQAAIDAYYEEKR